MTDKVVNIKTYKRRIGRSCMHCGRPAEVTGIRKFRAKGAWMQLAVAYCQVHAEQLINEGSK